MAGEAFLSVATIIDRSNADRSRVERAGEMLEALVRDHSRLVYRIAYAVLRRHHDAEDAAQETFLRVLRYGSKLPEVEDPKTWLARIAWRVAIDRNKRRRWDREIPLDDSEKTHAEPASADTPADANMQSAQVGAALEKLIAALPTKLRESLILSAIEEMSPREVATTLGISEAAVRSRVFRARQILKDRLVQRMEWK